MERSKIALAVNHAYDAVHSSTFHVDAYNAACATAYATSSIEGQDNMVWAAAAVARRGRPDEARWQLLQLLDATWT